METATIASLRVVGANDFNCITNPVKITGVQTCELGCCYLVSHCWYGALVCADQHTFAVLSQSALL